jgi:hypothetical protein
MSHKDYKAIETNKSTLVRNALSFADTFLSPVAKFGLYAMLGIPVIVGALFGALWWLDKNASWLQGAWPVLLLWALAFNRLPTQGRKCLEGKFNMRFVLPMAVLSTIGFVIGLFR